MVPPFFFSSIIQYNLPQRNHKFQFIALLDGRCGAAAPIVSPQGKVCAFGVKECDELKFGFLPKNFEKTAIFREKVLDFCRFRC